MVKKESTGCGAVIGFQSPPEELSPKLKRRKHKLDELLLSNPDIHEGHVLSFLRGLKGEQAILKVCNELDQNNFKSVSHGVRMHALREIVKNKISEIVRKKPDGGYVLYKPNHGKKGPPKKEGEFPTFVAAKRRQAASEADPEKKQRILSQIKNLTKKKSSDKDSDNKDAETKKKKNNKKVKPFNSGDMVVKKEGFKTLKNIISGFVNEALFREESSGSDWDDVISRIPSRSLSSDSKLQKLQKAIETKTEKILQDSFLAIKKALGKEVKLQDHGVKKAEQKTYLSFTAQLGGVQIEPVYIYIESGVPKIELSDQARMNLEKSEQQLAELFQGRLASVQHRVLDKKDDLESAISARDKYLNDLQQEMDDHVSNLTELQINLMKRLLQLKHKRT